MKAKPAPALVTLVVTGRWIASGVLGVALSAYVFAVVAGKIPQGDRLGAADLGVVVITIVAIALILSPKLLDRLQMMRLGGVELQLRRIEQKQDVQRQELDWLGFALTLLLTDRERRHLRELSERTTIPHTGGHQLRTELRRLATLRLVQRKQGVEIRSMEDNARVRVSDYVEITDRGLEYLARIASDPEAIPEESRQTET